MKNISGKRAEKAEAAPKDGLVTPSTHGRWAALISFITNKKSRGNDQERKIKLWFLTLSNIKTEFHSIEERFEVLNPAILKDKALHDSAEIIRPGFSTLQFV